MFSALQLKTWPGNRLASAVIIDRLSIGEEITFFFAVQVVFLTFKNTAVRSRDPSIHEVPNFHGFRWIQKLLLVFAITFVGSDSVATNFLSLAVVPWRFANCSPYHLRDIHVCVAGLLKKKIIFMKSMCYFNMGWKKNSTNPQQIFFS